MKIGVDAIERALTLRPPIVLPRAEDGRQAAVAAIVRDRGGLADVLLIRRAENPRDPWSGHMAFPGGRHEPRDPDLLATAVRETREEIGLDLLGHGRLLGQLDEIEAVARGRRTGLVIRPYVFALEAEVPIAPTSGHEVAEVLWGPLSPLVRGESDAVYEYKRDGFDLRLPAYDVDGRTVWGLTHQMLTHLFDRLRAGPASPTPRDLP